MYLMQTNDWKFKYEDYPQVAVSVDMLNTGFDCREILHLVMCRSVRSPILYQQIRGRGTRTAPEATVCDLTFQESRVFQRQRHRCLFGTDYRQRLWNSNQYAQRNWF